MTDIYGLVLAGGRSRRMGAAKAMIDYHGKPQQVFMFELLAQYCRHVYTSCKRLEAVPSALNPLPDHFVMEGPLNGLLTAFQRRGDVAWLTAPIDMPNIDAATLHQLISQRDPNMIATCFYDSDGVLPEPLLTLWEPAAAPLLEMYVQQGNFGIRRFLQTHRVRLVSPTDPKIHFNVNSAEDLETWRSHAKR